MINSNVLNLSKLKNSIIFMYPNRRLMIIFLFRVVHLPKTVWMLGSVFFLTNLNVWKRGKTKVNPLLRIKKPAKSSNRPSTMTINNANNFATVKTFWIRMAPRTLAQLIPDRRPYRFKLNIIELTEWVFNIMYLDLHRQQAASRRTAEYGTGQSPKMGCNI